MPKRKRQSSANKTETSVCSNPFLVYFGDGREEENTGSSFRPVLEFIELSKSKQWSSSRLDEVAGELLILLAANSKTDDESPSKIPRGLISTSSLISLLLPWAVKRLLQKTSARNTDGNDELLWKTVETCLDGHAVTDATTAKVLSMSALHKLVPMALRVACQTSDSRTGSIVAGRCYCIFVGRLYRPPFDSLCDSLLPLVARHILELPKDSKELVQSILPSTLRLMQIMLKRANPKRSFQQLVQPTVIAALSNMYWYCSDQDFDNGSQLVQAIVFDGIFNVEHHLDGFRSMQYELPDLETKHPETESADDDTIKKKAAKSDFRCYQEGLLAMIDGAANGDFTENSDISAAVIKAIPLFLQSFFHQSAILQEQLRSKPGRKKASYKISQIQFRFFARATFPLLKTIQNGELDCNRRGQILHCIGQNLAIVLKHDVYLPSNNEQSERDFACLASMFNVVQQWMKDEEKISRDEWGETFKILRNLLRLNHLVLHDEVPAIIASCLTCAATELWLAEEPVELLVTLIDTYQKLRQLDYIFRSITRLADDLHDSDDTKSIHILLTVGEQKDIRRNLEKAVRNSPLDQLRKIFSEMNRWIEEAPHLYFSGSDESHETGSLAISAVVRIFSILIRNIRVDSATAHEIYNSCQEVINTAVHGLLGDGQLDARMAVCTKDALSLCAWSIDLKNRCDFWIRNSQEKAETDSFTIPKPIVDLINGAVDFVNGKTPASDTPSGYAELEELQFLACYRIHQLHTDIHEKQRINFVADAIDYDTTKQVTEASTLAKFALKVARGNDGSESTALSRLAFLAGSVASWAPYAEPQHLDSFLHDVILNVASVKAAQQEKPTELDSNAAEILVSLLHDAGFYEIAGISERICGAALSCSAGLIQKGLTSLNLSKLSPNLLDFACPIRHKDWTRSEKGALGSERPETLLLPKKAIKEKGLRKSSEFFQAALQCLLVLNGMPYAVWLSSDDACDAFESALRLELLCKSLGNVHVELNSVVLKLVSTTRFTLSLLLPKLGSDPLCVTFVDCDIIRSIVLSIFGSAPKVTMLAAYDKVSQKQLLVSSQRLLISCVEYCSHSPGCFKGLEAAIEKGLSSLSEKRDDDKRAVFSFGHCLLNALERLSNTLDDSFETLSPGVVHRTADYVSNTLKNDAIATAFSEEPLDGVLREEALLLVGEILRHSTDAQSFGSIDEKLSLESQMVNFVGKLLRKKVASARELGAISYLIASLAMADPSHETKYALASQILVAGTKSNGVLESATCRLIEGMKPSEMEALLEVLTTEDHSPGGEASRIRFFRFMVLHLTAADQIEVIARFSRRFLFRSLRVLGTKSDTENWSESVDSAVTLIIDMFRSHDIIKTNERDIALVLCHLNMALNSHRVNQAGAFFPATKGIFDACFKMISFLLQRFSKQLHSCVPSLIGTLSAMLQHSLYGASGDAEIKSRGQKFTRLCELLMGHKDVYKKHILCLLVEFIQALHGDIDTTRKNSLSPAVYCLLDILQQHETAQLNAMLDDMGRALFRSLHESYKKLHVYKGQ